MEFILYYTCRVLSGMRCPEISAKNIQRFVLAQLIPDIGKLVE